jgi:hypothetical protein
MLAVPPFRQDNAMFLQSIFDIRHLQSKSYFLDAQCMSVSSILLRYHLLTCTYEDRIPAPLGRFISQAVYDSRLESVHELESLSCLSFVDVAMGRETNSGFSWTVSL